MSERRDYVLRVEHMDGTLSGGFHATDEDARMAARGWPEGTTTVHKLGPPISPPEPREWVVVWGPDHTVNDRLLPLEAAREERDRIERRWNPRIMRVVPEDPA